MSVRVLLDRYVRELRRRLGDELRGVWLFGSRARGEEPGEDSDVDLVVFVEGASWDGRMSVRRVLDDVAHELGLDAVAWRFSVHVHTLEWLAQRRDVRSFFIAHHVPSAESQDRLLSEVARVLRPGGVFAGTDSLGEGWLFRAIHVGDTLNLVDPEGLAGRLERAGLSGVEVQRGGRSFRFRGWRERRI